MSVPNNVVNQRGQPRGPRRPVRPDGPDGWTVGDWAGGAVMDPPRGHWESTGREGETPAAVSETGRGRVEVSLELPSSRVTETGRPESTPSRVGGQSDAGFPSFPCDAPHG